MLESAARLPEVVPDAVLVGGSASAAYAGYRLSFDHDHVLELRDRYEAVLEAIDEYYDDRSADDESVITALVPRLADPVPRDLRTLADLPRYKGLSERWHDWAETRRVCADLAQAILNGTRRV